MDPNSLQDLRQQWSTFDTALNYTPEYMYIFDLDGRITYANRAALVLWQRSSDEVLGRTLLQVGRPPDHAARILNEIRQVTATRCAISSQTQLALPSGKIGHYEYTLSPVFSADGKVDAVVGSTRDITDRKHAEELLEEDRRRGRELLLQVPAAIFVMHGPEHRFSWVNAAGFQLVGRPADDMIGRSLKEVFPELAAQGYAELLDDVFNTGQSHIAREAPVQFDNLDASPRIAYVDFVCMARKDREGQIDGTFVHATDVTDLVNARKQIEESEARYRFLAESIPQMVWTATSDGALDYVSAQVSAYFGKPSEELLGAGWLTGVHPEDREDVVDRWMHSIATGELYEKEFRLLRGRDGAWRWFLVRAHSMAASEGGHIASWVGTCTDIHDQKENEAALRRANRELEEFSYVASHDLQEPLRMVNIYTQMILRDLHSEDPGILQSAAFVRKGVQRMETLIRDLLSFSKAVHAEQTQVGSADLTAALQEALSVLKSRCDEVGARIFSEPLPNVRGETPQIAHVFQNLISNAVKYAKAGAAPEIHIAAELKEGEWIVSVHDLGIGFEPQYAERIFGLFKRLHKDEYPGTGLGLAICKRIVERYGGRIWAEGRLGDGATFYFALPPE